jgi:nucleotide-binding universal stress UspA family protein
MYAKILVPTDGTEFAESAITHAVALAKQCNAQIVGVTVVPPLAVMAVDGVVVTQLPDDYEKWAKNTADQRLAVLARVAKAAGVACELMRIDKEDAWAGIVEAAQQKGVDLIVMASHGRRGLSAVLLGSETQKVLTHSKVPVLVYR